MTLLPLQFRVLEKTSWEACSQSSARADQQLCPEMNPKIARRKGAQHYCHSHVSFFEEDSLRFVLSTPELYAQLSTALFFKIGVHAFLVKIEPEREKRIIGNVV